MNLYIETWKMTINSIITAKTLCHRSVNRKYDPTNDIREYASKQLKLLDDTRKDLNKSLYSQCNEEQKKFIDYLEKVIVYGKVDIENENA